MARSRTRHLTVGVVQLNTQEDVQANIAEALSGIDRAVKMGARFVSLPETWTYLGRSKGETAAAEVIPGELAQVLADKAREHSIWLHAGSMLEKVADHDKLYNTTLVFSPTGDICARYRKIHLFDADLAGHAAYRESDTTEPGDEIVTFEMDGVRVGLAICYDLRFPELFRLLALRGCEILMVPAAFTMSSGRDHWEPLLRARAIENQAFVVAAAQVGQHPPERMCYGRSLVIDPWGVVVAQASDAPMVITAELDLDQPKRVREQVPSLRNRAGWAYELTERRPVREW